MLVKSLGYRYSFDGVTSISHSLSLKVNTDKEEEYAEFLKPIPMPETEKDKLKGMNYSDVVIILNHYKNLMNRYFRKRF